MENLMLASTVIDLLAVAVLGWLVLRSGREREAGLGVQRAALESLRADLSQLVLEAERRAQGLEEALGARERRLRALLDEIASVETPRRELRRGTPVEQEEDDDRASRLRGADPAEARLLRDLQLSVGSRRA